MKPLIMSCHLSLSFCDNYNDNSLDYLHCQNKTAEFMTRSML